MIDEYDRERLVTEAKNMRWGIETIRAAEHLGWKVVDTCGVGDYQGWGVHLLKNEDVYAVMPWFYGSCSGCDAYEEDFQELDDHESAQHCANVFGGLIEEVGKDEEYARLKYDERKGW